MDKEKVATPKDESVPRLKAHDIATKRSPKTRPKASEKAAGPELKGGIDLLEANALTGDY